MPNNTKISDLELTTQLNETDLLLVSQQESESEEFDSKKTTVGNLAEKVATEVQFSGLQTEDKTIQGAINEAAAVGKISDYYHIESFSGYHWENSGSAVDGHTVYQSRGTYEKISGNDLGTWTIGGYEDITFFIKQDGADTSKAYTVLGKPNTEIDLADSSSYQVSYQNQVLSNYTSYKFENLNGETNTFQILYHTDPNDPVGTAAVDLTDSQFVDTGTTVDGHTVYMSNAASKCKIKIQGTSSFKVCYKTNTSDSYNRIYIGQLDTPVSSSEYETRDWGQSDYYYDCDFTCSKNEEHYVEVMFSKPTYSESDCVYFYVVLNGDPHTTRGYVYVVPGQLVPSTYRGEVFNDYENNFALGQYSHAEGNATQATGKVSHAEGYKTIAQGAESHAEGSNNTANGGYSHAEGEDNIAQGTSSHVEGARNVAVGQNAHVEGMDNETGEQCAHAEGASTKALGAQSHAEGWGTLAESPNSHAEGSETQAIGRRSHAEGTQSVASGDTSHAEGWSTQAKGGQAHSEGYHTIAEGGQSHAEGYVTHATGGNSHAEGANTLTSGGNSHAEGEYTVASGRGSHAEGYGDSNTQVISSGKGSHAEGSFTQATADFAHAEGTRNFVYSESGHAEGSGNRLYGHEGHIEGSGNTGTEYSSHTEGAGNSNIAKNAHMEGGGNTNVSMSTISHTEGAGNFNYGAQSHIEGAGNTISGNESHVEGGGNVAHGLKSHVEGGGNGGYGIGAHVEGKHNTAFGYAQHAEGAYNIAGYSSTPQQFDYSNNYAEGDIVCINNAYYGIPSSETDMPFIFRCIMAPGKIQSGNGVTIIHPSEWSSSTTYSQGDVVKVSGYGFYKANSSSVTSNPVIKHSDNGGNDWTKIKEVLSPFKTTSSSGYYLLDCRDVYGSNDIAIVDSGAEVSAMWEPISTSLVTHVEGLKNIATGNYQHVQGKYNNPDPDQAFIIGNGSYTEGVTTRSNAMTVDWNGDMVLAGDITPGTSLNTTATTIGDAINEIVARIPAPPTVDGTYTLTVTVSNGVPTYSWV